MLTQQPGRLAAAYGRDVVKLFALTRNGSPGDTPISRWQFQATFPYFSSHATPRIVATAIGQYGGGAPAVWRPGAGFLRGYQLDGGFTPGPLLALCALTGLAGSAAVAAAPADGGRSGDPALALACLLCFRSAGSVLLVSDLFEFSWRYQLPALVTLVPAGALGIGVVLRLARGRRA